MEHRLCPQTAYLPEVAKDISTSIKFVDTSKAVNAFLQELNEIQNTQEDAIDSLNADLQKHTDNISNTKREVVKYLDELEEASLKQLREKHSMRTKEIKNKIGDMQASVAELNVTLANLDLSKHTNENELFISMKAGKCQLAETESRLINIDQKMERSHLNFDIDRNLYTFKHTVKSFGEARDESNYGIEVSIYQKVSTDQDKGICSVTGMCEVDDGKVLLADWGSECLKVLDSSFRLSQSVPLPGTPFDVCVTIDPEVAITMSFMKQILFVSLANMTVSQQSIDVGDHCRGISCRCHKLYVACGSASGGSGQVRIYSRTGDMFSVVELKGNDERIFSTPYSLMFNSYGTRLYVADESNGVVVLDRHGRFISTFTDTKSKTVEGLAKCFSDDLLVCDSISGNIFHFESDGTSSSVTSNVRINSPTSLLWHTTTSKLLIGLRLNDCIISTTLVRQ